MIKILLALGFTAALVANPREAALMAGSASFSEPSPGMLEITTSDVAIINWAEFNINPGETTRFIQPGALSAVLNRVTGGNPSDLQGQLIANGSVYLLNPNGVFVSAEAIIQTNNFLATTFEIADSDFLAHDFASGAFFVPPAAQPHDHPFASAIRHEGQYSALNLEERGGRFYLASDRVEISGSVDAPSGEVRIIGDRILLSDTARIDVSGLQAGSIQIGGGAHGQDPAMPNADQVAILSGARLQANSTSDSNGGSIVVWSQNGTWFHGAIEAKGGPSGGNGGWVEVSGKNYLDYQGIAITTAPQGSVGTLLLDPINITVDGGDMNITAPPIFSPITSPSSIAPGTITGQLSMTNVIVESSGAAGAENGDIIISSPIMYTESNNLTFRTANLSPSVPNGDIQVNADVVNMGTGSIFFEASGNILQASANVETLGNISYTAGGSILQTSATVESGGNLSYTAIEDLILAAGGSDALISVTGAGAASLDIGNDIILSGSGMNSATIEAGSGGSISISAGRNFEFLPDMPSGSVGVSADSGLTVIVGGDLLMDPFATNEGSAMSLSTGSFSVTVYGNATLRGNSFIDSSNQPGLSVFNFLGDLTMLESSNMAQNLDDGLILNVRGNFTMIGDGYITADSGVASPSNFFDLHVGGSFYGQGIGGGSIDAVGEIAALNIEVGGNIQLIDEFLINSFNRDRPVTVQAGLDFLIDGLVGGNAGFSMNNDGPITAIAGRDFIMQNDARYDNNGNGALSITAGHSIAILDNSDFIFTGATPFTLICDNQFATPPDIGSGAFIKTAVPPINTNGGLLLIYTALREQNTIQGLLNGSPFVPGPLFINSATEMWGIYAPHNSGDPFTIFYKNILFPTNALAAFDNAYYDYLQNFFHFDRLYFQMKDFHAIGDARMVQPLYWPNNPVWFAPDLYLP